MSDKKVKRTEYKSSTPLELERKKKKKKKKNRLDKGKSSEDKTRIMAIQPTTMQSANEHFAFTA